MRVLIDGAPLESGIGGDETWMTGLLEGLAIKNQSHEFPILAAPGTNVPCAVRDRADFPLIDVPRRRGLRHFAVDLPLALRSQRADLVVTVTHVVVRSSIPTAVVIGDLSFLHHPEMYPSGARRRLNLLVPRQARGAGVVLTPSEYSRSDLIASYGLDPARVKVVPNRVADPVALDDATEGHARRWAEEVGVRAPFVLYLGNLHPRKNVGRLIDAFLDLRARDGMGELTLVLAGARWWQGGEEQQKVSSAPVGSVLNVGRVDEAVRLWLMREAVLLAYPSLFEGFGLPPLEAMSLGTPVLASDRTSLPEVLGDAALFVNPLDTLAITNGMDRIVRDPSLCADLRAAGPLQAASFSAARVGQAALRAFEETLTEPSRRMKP